MTFGAFTVTSKVSQSLHFCAYGDVQLIFAKTDQTAKSCKGKMLSLLTRPIKTN
eukprot:m.14912 g.14912  ORF g.14912 m.14912 type:complete len:54 (+) comp26045_c0_seq1:2163-2324(+)